MVLNKFHVLLTLHPPRIRSTQLTLYYCFLFLLRDLLFCFYYFFYLVVATVEVSCVRGGGRRRRRTDWPGKRKRRERGGGGGKTKSDWVIEKDGRKRKGEEEEKGVAKKKEWREGGRATWAFPTPFFGLGWTCGEGEGAGRLKTWVRKKKERDLARQVSFSLSGGISTLVCCWLAFMAE